MRDWAKRRKITTDEVRAMPHSIPESYLCPMQPGLHCLVPSAMAGMTVHTCTAQRGGLNSASLFSEASAALAWLVKMLGNLASDYVNWLVRMVFI